MTLTLLWEEYCAKCQEAGQRPYMSTQFGERYRRWARITKATMRIQHKPGDAMQADWAGDTIPIQDPVTGEQSAAYLFVAVLPCSYYTYAEACDDMKTENWLNCHVHAFDFFGTTLSSREPRATARLTSPVPWAMPPAAVLRRCSTSVCRNCWTN